MSDVYLGNMTGLRFEDVCCDILRGCNFGAQKIGGAGDGGRDIIIHRDLDIIIVECKHQAKPIGRPVVQKLHSAVMTDRAAGGAIISTGGFSTQAKGHEQVNRYSDDPVAAIRGIMKEEILLIDMEDLHIMAEKAGMHLHNGTDPTLDEIDTSQLDKKFGRIKSHPKSAAELMSINPIEQYVVTCWAAEYRIKQDFYNSAGTHVLKMNKGGKCQCGPDGKIIYGKFAKAVKKGGDAKPKESNETAARNNVIKYAISKHTKEVKYKAQNGQEYNVKCVPNFRHIQVSLRPVGVKRVRFAIKFLRKTYEWNLPDWDKKIECENCGDTQSMLKKLQLCNECGRIVHARSCGGQCQMCKKTICDLCAKVQRKLLRSKKFCSDCV